eukprot:TRINITY_DN12690_c0_g3_i2.p1 TRINITY_DN12690_c0_g3~~TRINITY_DN12690_c0_g3_i2.p1  ORF type:complete len:143 (-),score=46.59 TRINITY_DN12690_c0_g3_i2:107-535(-)
MVKEIVCLQRTGAKPKPQTRSASKPNFLKELAKDWSLFAFSSAKSITEDGFIFLTVRTPGSLYTTIFKEFKSRDNSCKDLMRQLKSKNIIKRDGENIKIYSKRESVWEEEDKAEGKFNSGQEMLVCINPRTAKTIRKASGNQ